MITWLQLTKLEYPIPATLEPGREYIFRIATDKPEHVSLTLDGEFVGNFHGGSLVFTTTSGSNELSLNSELDRQIVKGLTINEVETGYETRTSGFIKLFEATDKEFSSNGLLTIQPLKIFEVKKRSLNGWTIDVETPIEHKDFIEQDMLAVIQTKSKQAPQAFRISNIEYTQRKVKFTAHHVMFDADNYYIQKDDTSGTHNAASVLQRINTKVDRISPYVFTSDLNMSIDYSYSQLSLLEAMTLVEEQLGGNFDADNWNIKLSKNIGLDRGETIIYGKNLEDIKVFEDWSGVITRIFPEGKDGLILPEKYIDATIQYDIPYTKKIEFSSELEKPEEGEIDKEDLIVELRENAEAFLLESSKPKISYEVKSDINQSLEIGDTVYIKHPLVMIDAQVQEYEYDVIAGRVRKIVFGNYNRSVKKIFDKIKEDIKEVEKQTSKFEQIVNEQTDLIIGMNKFGHVYIDDNEILILDKLPKEEAVNVWRWGLGGLGFSSTGYEGPFTQAWTMDGKFNTEFISAKSITANQLASDVGASLDLSSNTSINLIVKSIDKKIEDIELTPGPPGIPGTPGENGKPTYTWIAYANNASGSGISLSPNGKDYVGYASGQLSKTPSITTPSLYTWQLVKGQDGQSGIPGTPGEDGKPVYTWIKYADTPTSGISDSPTGKKYIGMAFNKPTATESTTYSHYEWNLMPQNITIGGRNLLILSQIKELALGATILEGASYRGFYIPVIENQEYVLSRKSNDSSSRFRIAYTILEPAQGVAFSSQITGDTAKEIKTKVPNGVNYLFIYLSNTNEEITKEMEIKLEKGDMLTDWTPAPEDVDDKIQGVDDDLKGTQTIVKENTARSTLNENGLEIEIEERKTADGALVDDYTQKITASAEDLTIEFTKIDDKVGITNEVVDLMRTYYRLSADGAIIGKDGEPMQLHFDNDEIAFMESGTKVSWWQGKRFYVESLEVLTEIIIGSHQVEAVGSETIVRQVK